jgi:ACS family allantoate permease-like MFS transporter
MLVLRFSLVTENRRRDRLQQSAIPLEEEREQLEISDETDRRNLRFRYVY